MSRLTSSKSRRRCSAAELPRTCDSPGGGPVRPGSRKYDATLLRRWQGLVPVCSVRHWPPPEPAALPNVKACEQSAVVVAGARVILHPVFTPLGRRARLWWFTWADEASSMMSCLAGSTRLCTPENFKWAEDQVPAPRVFSVQLLAC